MSESNKFTPGPWVVSKDDSEIEKFVVAARGTVCEVFESFTADSVWGNAFLISAAPDLLEALDALVKINEDHNKSIQGVIGTPPGWNDSYLDAARKALAKARGQQ